MIIWTNGICFTQTDPYSDPRQQDHHPIKPMAKADGTLVSLIEFIGRDGNAYHVNPCRNCGALITYQPHQYQDA